MLSDLCLDLASLCTVVVTELCVDQNGDTVPRWGLDCCVIDLSGGFWWSVAGVCFEPAGLIAGESLDVCPTLCNPWSEDFTWICLNLVQETAGCCHRL